MEPTSTPGVRLTALLPENTAHADTPLGRIKVSRRRPTINKWVAWVRGEVIGRDYIDMDGAKRAAEHKVTKLMEKEKAGAEKVR